MLLWLFHSLGRASAFVAALHYVTFRAGCAALTAFLVGLVFGRWLIRRFRGCGLYEDISEPDSARVEELRKGKENTPTMGGLIILVAAVVAAVLWGRLGDFYLVLMLFTLVTFGALGWMDDWLKSTRAGSRGLTRRAKLLSQLGLGAVIAVCLWQHVRHADFGTRLYVPFWEGAPDIGSLYIPFAALVIVAVSTAANLTDGLDGLAAGCGILSGVALGALACVAGREELSRYLSLPYVPGTGETAVFCAALVGGMLAFLWYNCHPAEIFMGDTGSLAIGAALGLVGLALKQELALVLVCVVFAMELASVALQIGYFKMTGRRIFRCAPIHLHFQFAGWPETKVTVRFWILAGIGALVVAALVRL